VHRRQGERAAVEASGLLPRHIARWDLDKTYLRTDFDTLRDIVRTALERPDEKRTNPGAATLMREMVRAGVSVHILSGSPEQMRRRLEDKLRLDGITWDSFTLKPNLQNLLRLRFRAVRDQLGYKLPALLQARALSVPLGSGGEPTARKETLFGDDAEADAFVYSLYADVLAGRVAEETLIDVCERGRVYPDVIESVLESIRVTDRADVVERILIHLEQQTPPDDFRIYGGRAIPFYNYLQAAFIVHEDGRVPPDAVLRVAVDLVVHHRFDGDGLARSYLDLARRGHLRGSGATAVAEAFDGWASAEKAPGLAELRTMVDRLPAIAETAREAFRDAPLPLPDYRSLVRLHNARRSR
jgi:hypothetical protein